MPTDPAGQPATNLTSNTGNTASGSNITQNYIQQAAPPPSSKPVQHPIPNVDSAVGRRVELAAVQQRLGQAGTVAIEAKGSSATVSGVAGIGKSTLAALYCRAYGDEYRFVCWRDLRLDSTVGGLLLAVADLLGQTVDLREYPTEANQAAMLVNLLRGCAMLLVVDNGETVLDEVGNAVGAWDTLCSAAGLGRSRLLITSRQKVRAGRVLLSAYPIEGLGEADGVALLRQLGLTDDEALLRRAWRQAGGHPLALKLLAGLVVNEGQKLGRLLDERRLWQDEVNGLLDEVYARLDEQQRHLLGYVSVYDRPDLFRYPVTMAEVVGMLAAFPAALQPTPTEQWSAAALEGCALALSRRSLLNVEDERYTLHALVRDYAYQRLPDPPAHHRAAAAYFQQQYAANHPDAHTHPAKDLADVQPLLDAFDQLCAAGDYQAAADVLYGTYFEYLSGGNGVTLYALLDRWSEFSREQAMLERLVNAPDGTLRDGSRAVALGNLGIAYNSLGEYDKAIEVLSRRLGIAEQLGDRQGQANALGNLGTAYQSLGEYDKAIDYHSRALKIDEQIGTRQGQAADLGNLGNAYDSLGEYDKAIDYHSRYLKLAEQIGDRQGQANALGNLGISYRNLGEYNKAIDYHRRSLVIKQQIGDVAGQGNAWNNLGVALEYLKRYREALVCYLKAMPVYERISHPQYVALIRSNIARIRATVGEAAWPALEAEAQRLAEDAGWQPGSDED